MISNDNIYEFAAKKFLQKWAKAASIIEQDVIQFWLSMIGPTKQLLLYYKCENI